MNTNNDAKNILREYLSALFAGNEIDEFIDEDVEYISLNPEPGELAQILPWAGQHRGLSEFKKMYDWMRASCNYESFDIDLLLGDKDDAAAFGRFSYSSKTIETIVTTPFALNVKTANGKIVYFHFYEDTYATASAYRRSGHWSIENMLGNRDVGSASS